MVYMSDLFFIKDYTGRCPCFKLILADIKESIELWEDKDGKKIYLFNGELIRVIWLNGRKDSS